MRLRRLAIGPVKQCVGGGDTCALALPLLCNTDQRFERHRGVLTGEIRKRGLVLLCSPRTRSTGPPCAFSATSSGFLRHF